MERKSAFLATALVLATIIAGLGLMAYLGFYNRYWSDDWCYERDLKNLGVTQSLGTYFFTGDQAIRGYSTNRYSLTLLTAILYLPGLFGTQILPLLIIGLFIGALYWVLSILSRRAAIPKSMIFLAAAFFAYYVLYISPQRFQILYWRAGVHYTAAIITALLILGIILSQIASATKPSRLTYFAAALLGFLGGGLSETACVYMVSGFSLLLVAAWIGKKQGKEWGKKAFPLITLVIVVLLIAMAALILSPSNDRYKEKSDNPIPVFMIPILAPQFAYSFILQSLRSLPLPHFVFTLFFVAFAILVELLSPNKYPVNTRQAGALVLITIAVAFVLITAIQVPTTYFYSAPPDARGQSLSRFTILAGLAVLGWVIGQFIGKSSPTRWGFILAVMAMITISAYNVRLIYTNYTDLAGFIQRAELWDARDAMIREAVRRGETQIKVPVIDTQDIDTRDIMRSIDMEQWVTNCATEYYGAEAFRAIAP